MFRDGECHKIEWCWLQVIHFQTVFHPQNIDLKFYLKSIHCKRRAFWIFTLTQSNTFVGSRLSEFIDSFMNIKFDYCKCIRAYKKAHSRSDFRKKYFLEWGLNPRIYHRVEIQKYFRLFLVQMKTAKSPFEINWPLASKIRNTKDNFLQFLI